MTKMLWRASVGPLWLPFGHVNNYEWTSQDHDTALRHTGMTTNPSSVAGGSSGSLNLVDVAPYANGGGFWVLRPDNTMEYIAYETLDHGSDTVNGYSFWSEHIEAGQNIPADSEWYQWFPVGSDNGTLDFTEQLNADYTMSGYNFDINGIIGNKTLFSPHHLVAVEYSLDGTLWELLTLGVIRKASLQDDQQHLGAFNLKCSSLLEMIKFDNVKSLRYGEWVINTDLSMAADSTLSNIILELDSGDILTGQDTVEPDKAADDDEESLWVSNGYVDIPELGAGKVGIIGVYFDIPAGVQTGGRFIQCKNTNNLSHNDQDARNPRFYIYNATDGWNWIGSNGQNEPFIGWLEDDLSAGGHGLVVDREDEFTDLYPDATWDEIRDLQSRTVEGVYDFFKYFMSDGGAFYYRSRDFVHMEGLMWGSVSSWPGTPDGQPTPSMQAALSASPAPGFALLHYNGSWVWSDLVKPGIPFIGDEVAWLSAVLPPLDRRTAETYDAGTTYLQVLSQEDVPSSGGLPIAGGDVTIGESNYGIVSKDAEGITITPGLTEEVLENTAIYTFHRGQATWAYPIKKSTWSRDTGNLVPYDFVEGFANLVYARTPDESEYANDYWANPSVAANTAQTISIIHVEPVAPDGNPANGVRIANYYFLFKTMYDGDAAAKITNRARMNEINFLVDESFFAEDDTQDWFIDPTTVQAAIKKLLDQTRLGPNGSLIFDSGHTIGDYVTEPGIAFTVVQDLAKVGQALLRSKFDGKVEVGDGQILSKDYTSPSISRYWDVDTIRTVDVEQPLSFIIDFVTVEYILPDGTIDTVEYPDEVTRYGFGNTPEIGPFIVNNVDEALRLATNYFHMTRIPYTVHIELAEGEWDVDYIRVGQVHQVTWDWAEEGPLQRNFLILAINQNVQKGRFVTGISGIEVGRTTL